MCIRDVEVIILSGIVAEGVGFEPRAEGAHHLDAWGQAMCIRDVEVIILSRDSGGGGGIRTHGTLTRSTVFKTAAFDHSATPPGTASDTALGDE